METWQVETQRYRSSVAGWSAVIAAARATLAALKLEVPMRIEPTMREALSIQLFTVALGNVRGAAELSDGASVEWAAGRFVIVCLAVRLLLEFSATAWAVVQTTERLQHSEEVTLPIIGAKVQRLAAGARSPVRLPWGGTTETAAINILTLVEDLEKVRPGTLDDYAFLSAGSHPCHFQQFYLHMAGAVGDNWSNTVFAEHAHEILSRVVKIGDEVSLSLTDYVERTVSALTPLVARHSGGPELR